jgi:hypothetical protein
MHGHGCTRRSWVRSECVNVLPVLDVTYHKGKFYVISGKGVIVVCDVELEGPNPKELELVKAKPKSLCQMIEGKCREDIRYERFYIVESSGALLAVSQTRDCLYLRYVIVEI